MKIRQCSQLHIFLLCFMMIFALSPAAQNSNVIYVEDTILKEALEGYKPLPLRHIYPAGVEGILIPALDEILVNVRCYMESESIEFNATIKIDGEQLESKHMHMDPGERRHVTFNLPEMLSSRHEIVVQLDYKEPENLPSWKEEMDFTCQETSKTFDYDDLYHSYYLHSDVQIDGDLTEWEAHPYFRLGKENVGDADPDAITLTLEKADVYLGWDDKYFYLAVAAKVEEHHNVQSGSQIWNGDGIQFAIDPGLPGTEPFNLGVALASERVQSFQFAGPPTNLFEKSDYHVERDDDAKMTYYEIKMPFEALEIPVRKGSLFSFNIVVFEDADGRGYDYWLQMTRGIAGGWDTGEFNRFVFWK